MAYQKKSRNKFHSYGHSTNIEALHGDGKNARMAFTYF
jgi:hypothetical protein